MIEILKAIKSVFVLHKFIGIRKVALLCIELFKIVFIGRNKNRTLSWDFNKIRGEVLLDELKSRYAHLIPKEYILSEEVDLSNRIWVFWYQGELEMPDVVRLCVDSLRRNNLESEIIILDKDTYSDFVTMPPRVIWLLGNNNIGLAHFADILRVNLLYQQGGFWVDATLLVCDKLDNQIYNSCFSSIKNRPDGGFYFVSEYMWTSFFLYSCRFSPIFKTLVDLFDVYMHDNDCFIDYFLIDYFIRLIYDENVSFKSIVDEQSFNNPQVHELYKRFNSCYSEAEYQRMLADTKLFKLSYKDGVVRQIDGSKTFFGGLL